MAGGEKAKEHARLGFTCPAAQRRREEYVLLPLISPKLLLLRSMCPAGQLRAAACSGPAFLLLGDQTSLSLGGSVLNWGGPSTLDPQSREGLRDLTPKTFNGGGGSVEKA